MVFDSFAFLTNRYSNWLWFEFPLFKLSALLNRNKKIDFQSFSCILLFFYFKLCQSLYAYRYIFDTLPGRLFVDALHNALNTFRGLMITIQNRFISSPFNLERNTHLLNNLDTSTNDSTYTVGTYSPGKPENKEDKTIIFDKYFCSMLDGHY